MRKNAMSNGNGKTKTLGIFALAMINVAAVLSLRNYPSMAVYGWSSIGWYVIGTITFLLPLTLAGAELATGWPNGGGVYAWVKEAFGDKSGFIAIFCEWSNNLVWFPTLPFIATVVLLFAGMEMAGFHALEVRNPQKDFPSGMLLSALIIFVLTVVGTLAIAIVVPVSELNLAAGLMQAFQAFLTAFGLDALLAPLVDSCRVGWCGAVGLVVDRPRAGPRCRRRRRSDDAAVLAPQQERIAHRRDDPTSRDRHDHLFVVGVRAQCQQRLLGALGVDGAVVVHRLHVCVCRGNQAALLTT